ncbi:hypothetical protein A2V82_10805 [candidate division KSB1 bacterium RBG_16_48_16]|nr:MAG: hypothetical protein A2V82_10805 [candidate division KSB1 bacterium RBG_16_48_16]
MFNHSISNQNFYRTCNVFNGDGWINPMLIKQIESAISKLALTYVFSYFFLIKYTNLQAQGDIMIIENYCIILQSFKVKIIQGQALFGSSSFIQEPDGMISNVCTREYVYGNKPRDNYGFTL